MPLSDVQQLNARDGSYGQDIYGKRRVSGEAVPTMRGNQVVEIRTFTAKTNDFGNEVADQEVAGAECLVKAEDAEARIRTPGALHVPLYGYRSPDMTVQCIKPGFRDAVSTVNKYNLTQAQRAQSINAAGAGAGLIGALVATAVNVAVAAANDPTDDDYNYISPKLLLRPGDGSAALPGPTAAPASDSEQAATPESTTGTETAEPAAGTPAQNEPTDQKAPAGATVLSEGQTTPAQNEPGEIAPGPQHQQTVTGASSAQNLGGGPRSTSGSFTTPGLTEDSTAWERKCKPFCV
jgi:hypothetical protein